MRTRQKLTAVGAVTLATSAIGGGALATSHAMADSTTPGKGTMTVISMTSGSSGAIKCVYDNIDLPVVRVSPGAPSQVGSPTEVSGGAINVITGSGPVDANGKPMAGTVVLSSGAVGLPNGEVPAGAPTLVAVSATAQGSATEAGTTAGGAGETTKAGPVLSGLPPLEPIAIDSVNARPGTAEECAAMKPTALPVPPSAP